MLKLYALGIIGILGLSDVVASDSPVCESNNDLALKDHLEKTNASLVTKSCLRVDSEEDALCAEGNIASFFYHNKNNIVELKRLGALAEKTPHDLDYKQVKVLLIQIWNSETNIAAYFKTIPQKSTSDLINFQNQVWNDSYQLHSKELKSVEQLKQILNLLSALIDISHKVL